MTMKLTDYARSKIALILALNDRPALWILGYVFTYGPVSFNELIKCVEFENETEFYQGIDRLIAAKLILNEDNVLQTTDEGNNISKMLGLSSRFEQTEQKTKQPLARVTAVPNNFITNNSNKVLKDRISKLIGFSKELKFLVGFFYFSGIRELYEAIKNNPDVATRVLVGLNVDKQGMVLLSMGLSVRWTGTNINCYLRIQLSNPSTRMSLIPKNSMSKLGSLFKPFWTIN